MLGVDLNRKRGLPKWRRGLLATTAVIGLLAVLPTAAQNLAPIQFEQPSQPLSRAIVSFSRTAGIDIVADGVIPEGINAAPVSGTMSPEQALSLMLENTGLQYRFNGPRSVTLFMPGSQATATDGVTLLERLTVSGPLRSVWAADPDLVYQTPAAMSVITGESLGRVTPGSTADTLRGVPSAWTGGSPSDPGISVNMRGVQDFGRVNVMVDGVRQNFQYGGHGSSGTAYVDPALIAGVEVQRGAISTKGGGGTITGAVNFRTMEIDDLLRSDQTYGARVTATAGTNGYQGSSVLSGGMRVSENWDIFSAVSIRNSSDYLDATSKTVPSAQDVKSALVKTNLGFGDGHYLKLGALIYDNKFAIPMNVQTMQTSAHTFTAAYKWNPDDNDLINLTANAFVGRTHVQAKDGFLTRADIGYDDTTFGGNLSNTSTAYLGDATITATFGGEFQYDKVTNDETGGDGNYARLTPSGDRSIGGLFGEVGVNYGMFDVIGGLRYDHYRLLGSGDNVTAGGFILPSGPFNVDNVAGKLSPKLTVAATPVEGYQLYASTGQSFRPPAITEALMNGTHPGGIGNIAFSPNPYLSPEEANGWEAGINVTQDDVFTDGDSVRLKANYFRTGVTNFIERMQSCTGSVVVCPAPISYYQNVPGTTQLSGWELEASYDAGFIFGNAAYSSVNTEYDASAVPAGSNVVLRTQPPQRLALTAGVRLFEEKLTLGGRADIVPGFDARGTRDGSYYGDVSYPGYQVYDVFASYEVNDNATIFGSVENITNAVYEPGGSIIAGRGPGLTAKIGFTGTFAE